MEFWIVIIFICIIFLFFSKNKKDKTLDFDASKFIDTSSEETSVKDEYEKADVLIENDGNINNKDDQLATFTLNNEKTVDSHFIPALGKQSHQSGYDSFDRGSSSGNILGATVHYQGETDKDGIFVQWIQPDDKINICGVEITRGNIYVGQRIEPDSQERSSFNSFDCEPSLIDESLHVQSAPYSYSDSSLGYWPSYAFLSDKARGAYLSWLASDRDDVSCPIGYVFIYFYGLERRVLIDGQNQNVSEHELQMLFNEISRLRMVFIKNRSFNHYSSQLLEAASILYPEAYSASSIDGDSDFTGSMRFKLDLAKTVKEGRPVSADQACIWVIKHMDDYELRMPIRRCMKEFSVFFKNRYHLKYGDGLLLEPNKARLRLGYKPASDGLRGMSLLLPDLPDPSMLKEPRQKIMGLADICTNELEPYSRYLSRKGTSEQDAAAIVLLPIEAMNHEVSMTFKEWADDIIETNHGLTSVLDFWTHMGVSCPVRINKKEYNLMQAFARKMGYDMAPDPFYHHVKVNVKDALVLFVATNDMHFSPSPAFVFTVIMLRLGAMVALVNNDLDQAKWKILKQVIDSNQDFTADEKRSLHAYLTWQLHSPVNMAGIKNRMALLDKEEKTVIGRVIVEVACSDGKIEPAGIKELEKIYSGLGLDSVSLSSDIHQYSSMDVSRSSVVKSTDKTITGFTLDPTVLARHESATKDVHKLLDAILTKDETEIPTDASQSQREGLDSAHNQFYHCLLKKERWSQDEAEVLCKSFDLILGGALEVINDWSYAKVDALVLEEEGGSILVDSEIVKELEE